ncbi:BBSome-interacting protein 1 [Anopheles funestus]|uniref:BBSome-interacting protein 1 n=1 Tax=Anopheles funestus TaxID=62324 RepID=UPI0020C6E9A5|nr:BBSome-interacting protein 1 [Anopheles funestus]XP_049280104.1 BBSome-interacting protein 1 [Anopheles funestus]
MSLSVADTTTLAETVPSSTEERSNKGVRQQQQPITLILPTSGKLFFEKKQEFQLCKPQLLPLKSFSLEKLERMHQEAQRQLQETRARTAASKTGNNF